MSRRFPMPIPFGWYCVAYSDELERGQSVPLRYFGGDQVLFRTESGKAVMLDAYCPHLGAHLGYGVNEEQAQGGGGRVQGETIVCPFHAWRFDANGMCVEVPYARNMPPKVKDKQCLRTYPICESNQVIWAWYHPQGEPPSWEVQRYEEMNSDEWSELERHRWTIASHPQELAENGSDPAHFLYVHQTATMPDWELNYEGKRSTGRQRAKLSTPQGEVNGQIHTISLGPGQAMTRFTGICETFLCGMVTPIDEEHVDLRFAFTQKMDGQDLRRGVGAALIRDIVKQLSEDAPIWEHKIYRDNPVLCDGDGPIAKFRKWYSQFYAEDSAADQRVLA